MKGKTTNWNNKTNKKVLYLQVQCGGTNHLLEENWRRQSPFYRKPQFESTTSERNTTKMNAM